MAVKITIEVDTLGMFSKKDLEEHIKYLLDDDYPVESNNVFCNGNAEINNVKVTEIDV